MSRLTDAIGAMFKARSTPRETLGRSLDPVTVQTVTGNQTPTIAYPLMSTQGIPASPQGGTRTPDMNTPQTPSWALNTPSTTLQNENWFGPGVPLRPVAPAEVAGRMMDYPVNYNVNIRPRSYEAVDFPTLRGLADAYDLMRLIIETRKDQVESYDWEIIPKEGKTVPQSVIDDANQFFLYPDGEHVWNTWMRMVLEDLLVIDAVAIYPRLTKGGDLFALELMDGATIRRVLDPTGRTPMPPDPAYQQVLKGLPAVDYTTEELFYTMRNPRTNRFYGYSPVEQVIMTVNIALRRQLHQLEFYTSGSIPEAFAGVPDTWSAETIQQFQLYWDNMMEGNTAERRKVKFLPMDASKMEFPKSGVVKDDFDDWLSRIVCFAFSISPTALVRQTNRATAQSSQEVALNEGLIPILNWIKRMLDLLISNAYGQPDLEFKWQIQKDLDPLVQAQVDQIYVTTKVVTPDEVRERLGMEPLTAKQQEQLNPAPPPPTLQPGQAPSEEPGVTSGKAPSSKPKGGKPSSPASEISEGE